MNKRINFIDIARGFAIIFIVLGHAITYSKHCEIIYKILCSFHVVLFFILSGYTFRFKENETFFSFIKRKFNRIMIPYFIWATLFLIPYMMFGKTIIEETGAKGNFNILRQLLKILYGNGNEQGLKQNTALWFLPALFSMEAIYYWIIKIVSRKKNYIKVFTLFLLLFISYVFNKYVKFVFPFGINTVIVLGIFFYIGYLLYAMCLLRKEKLFKIYYIIPIFIFGIIAALTNEQISAVNYRYGNLFLCIISGICLSLVVMYISYIINKNRLFEYIGKNTMCILIFHKLIVLIFQTKLGEISKILKDSNCLFELGICIIVLAMSIISSIIISKCINKTKIIIQKQIKFIINKDERR